MDDVAYVGMNIHKKTIVWCAKDQSGRVLGEGILGATRRELRTWCAAQPRLWVAAMEATQYKCFEAGRFGSKLILRQGRQSLRSYIDV